MQNHQTAAVIRNAPPLLHGGGITPDVVRAYCNRDMYVWEIAGDASPKSLKTLEKWLESRLDYNFWLKPEIAIREDLAKFKRT